MVAGNASVSDISPFFENALHNCRLFADDNSYLGLAPLEVEIGDVVCTLFSAKKLCILRARPRGGWTLVCGECYMPPISFPSYSDDVEEWEDEVRTEIDTYFGVELGDTETFMIW